MLEDERETQEIAMLRPSLILGLALASAPAFAGGSTTPATVVTFNDEVTAQTRCPLDTVVWLDTHSHLYYKKHSKMYANTAHGGFACMKEVKEAGNKAAAKD
jgi:hypothetical protein